MTRTRYSKGNGGFTLIEMMIAMTLLSVLGLMLVGSLGFGGHVAEAASMRSERIDRLWTAFSLMRTQIAVAQPMARSVRDSKVFFGTPDAIRLTAPMPTRLGLGGDQNLTFRIEGPPGARRLIAEWQSSVSGDGSPGRRNTLLLDGLSQGVFAYFGAQEADEEPHWQPSWVLSTLLPTLVRFTASFADGTRVPDLIVAPRISGREP